MCESAWRHGVEHSSPGSRLMSELESARSPDKAILLIRALRRRGHAQSIVPVLVEIVGGVAWDPGRQAWLVALRTLATHAQKTKDPRALRATERAVHLDGLTDLQLSWAKRCLSIAQKPAPDGPEQCAHQHLGQDEQQ